MRNIPLLVAALAGFSQPAGVQHIPPASYVPGNSLVISVSAEAPRDILRAELNFREIGEDTYRQLSMTREGNMFSAEIRPSGQSGLEYFVLISSGDGKIYVLPPGRSRDNPQEIMPSQENAGYAVEVLSPEPGAAVAQDSVQVLFGFTPPLEDDVVVTARFDGRDVTADCEMEKDFLLYAPMERVSRGIHSLTVEIELPAGETLKQSVEFTAGKGLPPGAGAKLRFLLGQSAGFLAGGENPYPLHGSASASYQNVTLDKGDASSGYLSYPPGNFGLFDLNFWGEALGGSCTAWLSQNPLYTPSFQMGVEVSARNLTVEAGDLFPFVSELTLYGLSPEGIRSEYRFGGSSVSAMALKTSDADTLLGKYTQYLEAAGTELKAGDRVTLGGFFSYAKDISSTLTNSFFPPLRNGVAAGSLTIIPWRGAEARGELAWSLIDTIDAVEGWNGNLAFEAGMEEAVGRGKVGLTYRRVSEEYLSLGAPYLESGKETVTLNYQGKVLTCNYLVKGIRTGSLVPGQGVLGTTGWSFVGRVDMPVKKTGYLSSDLEYDDRAYGYYGFKTLTGSLSFSLNARGWKMGSSATVSRVAYSSEDTSAAQNRNTTNSVSLSVNVERGFFSEKVKTKAQITGFTGKDSAGLYSQSRVNPLLSAEYALGGGYSVEARYQVVDRQDQVTPVTSYRESTYTATLKRTF